jgi:DnaK suppressor protein
MEEKDKQAIREKIQSELTQLEDQIKNLIEVTQPISPDNAIGRITRMDAINNKAVNDAALVKTSNRKERLEKVLAGVDTPDFGICVGCKKPIPHLRLMHIPETRVCVGCGSR